MFNEQKLRIVMIEKGITITDIAKAMGISTVTLYRKMSGESDFFRKEIQSVIPLLGEENIKPIFFAEKVT